MLGFLSRRNREMDPYLEMRRENRDSAWVVAGPSVFLSSGDGYVGNLLELPRGFQTPVRGSRVKVGFLWRHSSGKMPHLTFRGESPPFSRVVAANLGFLLSYNGDLRDLLLFPWESPGSMRVARGPLGIPLLLLPWPRSSSGVEAGTSGFFSSADMELAVPLEFTQGSQV